MPTKSEMLKAGYPEDELEAIMAEENRIESASDPDWEDYPHYDCPACLGTGEFPEGRCNSCHGIGVLQMSCDICGRGACAPWMHSFKEQESYQEVIEAFDTARELRRLVRERLAGRDEEEDNG